jgi:hypothetical protein
MHQVSEPPRDVIEDRAGSVLGTDNGFRLDHSGHLADFLFLKAIARSSQLKISVTVMF